MNYLDLFRATTKQREKSEKSETSPELLLSHEPAGFVPHPPLPGIRVYHGPVEASTPPEGWNGIAPTECARRAICQALGPCRHFTEHGACWKGGNRK